MFKLVIQDDEGKTTVVPLIRDEITIGRKEGNTIRLTERNVSRRHARILRQNGEVQIEDLGSYNGIRVNNARIAERVSLRVSDQVQIGDYKLYLKAEGVEQVDDARTMPIERVDTASAHGGATDILPAVAAAVPPTQPMAIQTPAPGTLPAASQLIGNPNRTLVAIADTDPQGRPVASPAQVAAVLSSPVGYGKLVVLSSNFAGKEFELSRPQMIIGRTDENDIVVNHRSISRNHAKLVREPDTGRYTISDLQSSNGVRVNGQDYGKVELRRGDVVDLGHVRLRFVEAGEDFVFSRDAVITDVPDSSSKKGVWIAAIAVLLLFGGGAAYMLLKKDKASTSDGSGLAATADAGSQLAVADDAGAVESTIDAGAATVASNDIERLRTQCLEARDNKRWPDLITCGEQLRKLDAALGKEYYDTAHAETQAEQVLRQFKVAVDDGALKKAKQELDKINKDSVYRAEAQSRYEKEADKAKVDLVGKLKAARRGDCKTYNQLVTQLRSSHPTDLVDAAKDEAPCTPVVAQKDPIKDPPPKQECNADELNDKGTTAMASQSFGVAMSLFEQAYKCNPTNDLLRKVFLMGCKTKNIARVQSLYKKSDAGTRSWMIGACANNGVPQSTFENL